MTAQPTRVLTRTHKPTPNTNTQTGNNNADAAAQIAFKAAKQGVLPVTPVTDGKRLASYYIDINGKRVVEVDGKTSAMTTAVCRPVLPHLQGMPTF